jgi:hypothetical protein
MLIEPAILLLFNSIRVGAGQASGLANTSTSLSAMLFDFLCRIASNYHLPYRDNVLNGIMQSFKDSVEKKVIPSLHHVFFIPQIDPKTQLQLPPVVDRELRTLVQSTFGNFFQTLNLNQAPQFPPSLVSPSTPPPQPPTTTTPPPQQQQQPLKSAFNESPTNIFNSNSNTAVPTVSQLPSSPNTIPSPTPSPLVSIGSSSSLFKQKMLMDEDIVQQFMKSEPPPPSLVASPSSSPSFTINEPPTLKFESQVSVYNEPVIIKTENMDLSNVTTLPLVTISSDHGAFSSDEDDEIEEVPPPVITTTTTTTPIMSNAPPSLLIKQQPVRPSTPAPPPTIITSSGLLPNPSPSPMISSLQLQLAQFATRPFKAYTMLDDTQTIGAVVLSSANGGAGSQHLPGSQSNSSSYLENLLNSIGKCFEFG